MKTVIICNAVPFPLNIYFDDQDQRDIKIKQVDNEDFPGASCYLLSSNSSAKR